MSIGTCVIYSIGFAVKGAAFICLSYVQNELILASEKTILSIQIFSGELSLALAKCISIGTPFQVVVQIFTYTGHKYL
ncbi:hypothetical protein IKI14_00745 [bacterium]|nr:hypothetical protein [bacterium]